MKGIPKVLSTKADYMNILALFSADECRPHFKKLLNSRYHFVVEGELLEGDDGITDKDHKVTMEVTENGVTRYQMVRVENPNAKLFKIGFTVSEIESILQN